MKHTKAQGSGNLDNACDLLSKERAMHELQIKRIDEILEAIQVVAEGISSKPERVEKPVRIRPVDSGAPPQAAQA